MRVTVKAINYEGIGLNRINAVHINMETALL